MGLVKVFLTCIIKKINQLLMISKLFKAIIILSLSLSAYADEI